MRGLPHTRQLTNKTSRLIKALKYLFRIGVLIMLGGYLMLLGLTAIPSVQRWLADLVGNALAERMGTRVHVQRVRLGLPGRLIVDGLQVYDRRDSLMLHVPRVAAKIEVTPLFEHHICISNAQLFGARALLYHAVPDSAPNWQFLVDAFSPPHDTTPPSFDLRIRSLLARRCQVRYDRLYEPHIHGRFDHNHLSVTGLSVTAQLGCLTRDSLDVNLDRLACRERSGLELDKLKFRLKVFRDSLSLERLEMRLPRTSLTIPMLTATYQGLPRQDTPRGVWLSRIQASAQVDLTAVPADLAALAPSLRHMDRAVSLSAQARLDRDGQLSLHGLRLSLDGGTLALKASMQGTDLWGTPSYTAHIHGLSATHALWTRLPDWASALPPSMPQRLQPLGNTRATGQIYYSKRKARADMTVHTEAGTLQAKGHLDDGNHFQADLTLADARIGAFLGTASRAHQLTLSATATLRGKLHGQGNKPEVHASGNVQSISLRRHTYHDIPFHASMAGHDYRLALKASEQQGQVSLDARATLPPTGAKTFALTGSMEQFSPWALSLTDGLRDERISGQIQASVSLEEPGQPEGEAHIANLVLSSPEKGRLDIGDISLTCHREAGLQRISMTSDMASLEASGTFRWESIPKAVVSLAKRYLPSLVASPHAGEGTDDVDLDFTMRVRDTTVAARLTGTSLSIPEEAVIHGYIHSGVNLMELDGQIPRMRLGNEQLHNGSLRVECTGRNMQASVHAQRMMRGKPVDIDLAAYAENDRLVTRLGWDNQASPLQRGAVNLSAQFWKAHGGKTAVRASLNPSDIVISDSVWHIRPGVIHWHNGRADVSNVSLASSDRHLTLNGFVSSEEEDTLTVDVKDFDLAYLFNIVNFHAVDFKGFATGRVYGRTLTRQPQADAFLQVHDFSFNGADMGEMDVHINWGARPKTIQLDAYIQDPPARQQTMVRGSVTLGHGPGSGLDLDIDTRRMDLHFLHRYASAIFSKMEGRVTGACRVFGPFKNINLQGKVVAEEASLRVASLGVDYHLAGDSVILVPDTIRFPGATIYDNLGGPGSSEHAARLSGELTHRHLSHMGYDIRVDADNILAYNFPQMEDLNFCGTVFASGTAHVHGYPGTVNIDVKATPKSGTTLVYNTSSPTTVTDTSFLTYVSHADSATSTAKPDAQEAPAASNDLHLNFDLDVTPEATMRVLMDTKSGDYINLYGNGRILANYYNKGKFQMYGTYRVDHGLYKLSIQDVIRKDFTFRPGGTITFGGDPGKAALQLSAVYTVPNVSLDDLSSSSLGLSNTRVDCIMDISGEAFAPTVTFDFDLPNANEDEKRMVRSMLSTDEERNMQVIYLLGIGRFYNQNTQMQNAGNQSGTAMNSLISSTLSSQFNQFMNNAMGSRNWSFGANLRTGENGWDQLDIEGILSGRLLNNRLLINGNFGYRENYYSTSNFIGDFDVQYLLTPNGNLSLKAYNQTNDRYFIQSSLTTQGVGLQFKRDFNSWRGVFRRIHKAKRQKKAAPTTPKPVPDKE